jgi:hypothetical protein
MEMRDVPHVYTTSAADFSAAGSFVVVRRSTLGEAVLAIRVLIMNERVHIHAVLRAAMAKHGPAVLQVPHANRRGRWTYRSIVF